LYKVIFHQQLSSRQQSFAEKIAMPL